MELYYDDYRKCIDKSNELLKESLTDFDIDENKKSLNDRFIVHELKGKPFGMLITCGYIKPFFGKTNLREKQKKLLEKGILSLEPRFNDTATSLSYLDENFIKSNWGGTVIGFRKKDINPKQIIAVNPYDLGSSSKGFNRVRLDYTNIITTPKDLTRRTVANSHNEIVYRCKSNDVAFDNDELNKNLDALVPAYIICYNEITKKDINIAEEVETEFGEKLEFVVIYEEKYKNSIHYETEEEKTRRESEYIF